ncbi:hypothetical protein QFZ27_001686 [Inquilinus ginsengisoli]|uniref:hypothetical protein n=1 Tax=Inquilinus ginsengisoli TaxID=363840 RepID=UPI003D1EF2CD
MATVLADAARRVLTIGLVADALRSAASAIPAMARDTAVPPANTTAGPRFAQITPYAWLPSVSGTTGGDRRVPSLSIDQSFSDILSDLDLAGMIVGAVRDARIGLFVDWRPGEIELVK